MPIPCFWFASDVSKAFKCYADALPAAEVTLDNGFFAELSLGTSRIAGMNGGPTFKPNKTVSVFAELPDAASVHAAYGVLSEGDSEVYMELAKNPWSEAYTWFADRWGVNWQLMAAPERATQLSGAMLFTGDQAGKAEAAMRLYAELFDDAKDLQIERYPESMGKDAGLIMHAQQRLNESKLIYCESSHEHNAAFSEGGSLMIHCDTQAEIDRCWKLLTSNGGSAGRCGWCKDRFGVSWQIVPRKLGDWMSNPRTAGEVGQRMQQMGKLILEELQPKNAGGLGEQLGQKADK